MDTVCVTKADVSAQVDILERTVNQAVQIRVPVRIVVLEFVLQIRLQMMATFAFANSTTPVLDVK
jgi:hypothetical protein